MTSINTNTLREAGLLRDEQSQANSSQNDLNQSAFLELMTTQLMNQNPTKPMENGDFLGQMAQFSTVSGIEDLNTSIASLVNTSKQSQLLEASSVVGKQVLLQSGSFENNDASSIEGEVSLSSSAQKLEVKVFNEANAVVRTIGIPNATTGQHNFTWDGKDDNGNSIKAGNYRFVAEATRNEQTNVASVQVYDTVDSVQFANNEIILSTKHQGDIRFNQVSQIK